MTGAAEFVLLCCLFLQQILVIKILSWDDSEAEVQGTSTRDLERCDWIAAGALIRYNLIP